MGRVYSYLRFSDPKQAAGSSADRQMEYARKWAAERGLVLDESLSLRDEGLSAYHQTHVAKGALGVFLRAVEDGRVDPGSVLVVEGLDRLSRAEPLQAQAQLTQIVHAGITVVTAADGQEYSLEAIRANPYKLIHSLVVMIRAHEESDTKSKRVRAAIRRQCEGWLAGTWRGIVRNGKDPQWVRWNGQAFDLVPERAEALRWAIGRFMDGAGGVSVMREMAERGLAWTDSGALKASLFYLTLRKRLLVGDRELTVDGETYVLPGYYPPLIDEAQWQALQLALDRRGRRRGPAEIPGIVTGLGITYCGYCGQPIIGQNLMTRKKADGRILDGHRRIICLGYSKGAGCPVPGSASVVPIERAMMVYCADQMRLDALLSGGDRGTAMRADLAKLRTRAADLETRLAKVTAALEVDDGPTPLAIVRKAREIEAAIDRTKAEAQAIERELAAYRQPATPALAAQWLALLDGVESLDTGARLKARELVREHFSRITIWHSGQDGADEAIEMEITARGGGTRRLRIDRKTGMEIDD